MRASLRDARVYVTGEHACVYRTRRDVTLAWQMQPRRTYLALLLRRFLAQPLVLRKELREQTNTTAPSRTALHCTGTTVRPTAWRTLSKRAAAAEPSLSAAVSASEACKAKQGKPAEGTFSGTARLPRTACREHGGRGYIAVHCGRVAAYIKGKLAPAGVRGILTEVRAPYRVHVTVCASLQ